MIIPYLERLDKPVLGTTYYKALNSTLDMPNCTKYCTDRAHEAVGDTQLKLFEDLSAGGFHRADKWITYSALPTGDEPREASIGVCSGDGGSYHVFFIERKNQNGTFLISDSRYRDDKSLRDDTYWRLVDNVKLEVGKKPDGIAGCGKILGFMYIPINDVRVKRDSSRSQVEIIKPTLRLRKKPSLSGEVINPGCYVPMGVYNVIETASADGYTWCKIATDAWFAISDAWAKKYYVVEPTPTPDPEPIAPSIEKELEDLFKEITDKFNELNKKVTDLESANKTYKEGLAQIADIASRLIK